MIRISEGCKSSLSMWRSVWTNETSDRRSIVRNFIVSAKVLLFREVRPSRPTSLQVLVICSALNRSVLSSDHLVILSMRRVASSWPEAVPSLHGRARRFPQSGYLSRTGSTSAYPREGASSKEHRLSAEVQGPLVRSTTYMKGFRTPKYTDRGFTI